MLTSHCDNCIEVNVIVTPSHIVPEWYLLSSCGVLKGIPHINGGFLLLILTLMSCIYCNY